MSNIENMLDQIHLGKCDDILPMIPSGSVDMVITSPPYNVSLGKNKFKKDSYDEYEDNLPYDKYLEWMESVFKQCHRVLKHGGRICVNVGDGQNGKIPTHADFIIRMRDNVGFLMITTIVWNKGQISNRCSWGSYCSPINPSFPCPFEYIIVMAKETYSHEGKKEDIDVSAKEFQDNSLSLWDFSPETQMMDKFGHPAVFPEMMPRKLMKQLTYKNDVILDPFSGSGTTCCVAKELKRRFIGIEMSKKYWSESLNRLSNVIVPQLFE